MQKTFDKSIKIRTITHENLSILKVKWKVGSIDDVIQKLIDDQHIIKKLKEKIDYLKKKESKKHKIVNGDAFGK